VVDQNVPELPHGPPLVLMKPATTVKPVNQIPPNRSPGKLPKWQPAVYRPKRKPILQKPVRRPPAPMVQPKQPDQPKQPAQPGEKPDLEKRRFPARAINGKVNVNRFRDRKLFMAMNKKPGSKKLPTGKKPAAKQLPSGKIPARKPFTGKVGVGKKPPVRKGPENNNFRPRPPLPHAQPVQNTKPAQDNTSSKQLGNGYSGS